MRGKVGSFQPGDQGKGLPGRGHHLGESTFPGNWLGGGGDKGWTLCLETVSPGVILRQEVNSGKIVSTGNFNHKNNH